MKKFNVTVNGKTYEVEVEEVGAPQKAAAPAAPAAAPAPSPAAQPVQKAGTGSPAGSGSAGCSQRPGSGRSHHGKSSYAGQDFRSQGRERCVSQER